MIIIGLTGSIAMGKSEVAKIISSLNIPLFDADREVHEFYDSREGVALLQPFVPQAINDGKIDRSRLTALVMKNPELLEHLEALVHAEVGRRRDNFIANANARDENIVVLDIPLLFEKNQEQSVTHSVVVSSPAEVQRLRAMSRPGMTTEKYDMILKRQLPDVEKRRRADYIIENNGTHEELKQHTLDVLAAIKRDHSL